MAVPRRGRVACHVVGVEKIGLGAGGARNPLPAQMVAGQVAVEQVRIQPVGTGAPVDPAQMHHIARQPHARVVVQVAGGIEGAHGGVDHRHACAGLAHIGWQDRRIGLVGQRAAVQRPEDAFAAVLPHMAEVGAPAEFEHEPVLGIEWLLRRDHSRRLGQLHEAMGDVGREPGHRAVKGVARAGVVAGTHGGDARMRRFRRRREHFKPKHVARPCRLHPCADGRRPSRT